MHATKRMHISQSQKYEISQILSHRTDHKYIYVYDCNRVPQFRSTRLQISAYSELNLEKIPNFQIEKRELKRSLPLK